MNRILILCMALLSISQAYSQKTFVGVVKVQNNRRRVYGK